MEGQHHSPVHATKGSNSVTANGHGAAAPPRANGAQAIPAAKSNGSVPAAAQANGTNGHSKTDGDYQHPMGVDEVCMMHADERAAAAKSMAPLECRATQHA